MLLQERTSEFSPQLPRNSLSYVRGEISTPLLTETIGDALKQTAERFGDRDAAIFCQEGVRWTWKELREKSLQLAAAFSELGIGKGDRIGIWSTNRPEWLLTQFAAHELGAILVNINPANQKEELRQAISKVGMKAIVCAEGHKRTSYASILEQVLPQPTLETLISMADPAPAGMLSFKELLKSGAEGKKQVINAALHYNDPINIQFTSGTTGAPKAATLTHFNILNNAKSVVDAMNLTEQDRLCIPVPLFHCFGMVMGVLGCVNSGACMVFPGRIFDAEDVMKAVDREKCTALYGVPTMFISQLNSPQFEKYDFSSLRTGIMAGAPCPIETMKLVVSKMHIPEITIAYGMTETGPVSFQSDVNDPLERRVNTVGRVLPHLEVKIVDKHGEITPIGVPGELLTKGYSVMAGYWGDDEQTRKAIVDSWMHSGDMAVIDEEGYANITGRIKEMIIRGGENVYPKEIEDYLFTHPKIASVQVFGVPSKLFGESVAAWVILKPGESADEQEIRDFCRGQIAAFKIPQYVQFVSEFPTTQSGKPQKFKMREEMRAELGVGEITTA